MIARVTLELALRKEFDYLIPPELVDKVDVGSRVQVPFGGRKMLGCVTALAEESAHARLRPIIKVIGAQTLVTPKILKLARWIGELLLRAESPQERARKRCGRKGGWRERLFVQCPLRGIPCRSGSGDPNIEERRECRCRYVELRKQARPCALEDKDW
jgi:primosomal protein N' (replication factor Y)